MTPVEASRMARCREKSWRIEMLRIDVIKNPDTSVKAAGGPSLTAWAGLNQTGWILPPRLSQEQWVICGAALERIEGAVQWWLGDWWAYGDHEYGERLKALEDPSGPLADMNFGTLRTYGWVARQVTTSTRVDVLSFAHHKYVAPLPPAQQRRWLARAVKEGWSSNQLKAAIAHQAARDKTREVEFDAAALGKFVVLYADPPWRYENPPMGGSNRSIENQYPTMDLEEICALPVADIAHDDCILFLWATNPKSAECMKVIEAWGFVYRTNMVWVKDKIGMGYHARERHECLLIAKRGKLPPPPVEARPDSVVEAPRLEHSAKPPVFYDIIDRMYLKVRKIELFERNCENRPYWSFWGNQALKRAAEAAE
jgi:N6-adenosine-specific RNA methylase IME4